MTLIRFESGKTLLIDCNIRQAADSDSEDAPDVANFLRDRLDTDFDGNFFVDAFVLSHPDQDHCGGLQKHFHLGSTASGVDQEKIIIREMWSSPIVFRRSDRCGALCDAAKAWADEARRRVKAYRYGHKDRYGNGIRILGEDIDGKTDGLEEIQVRVGESFSEINGFIDPTFSATLLGPKGPSDDDETEDSLAKNRSSVILRFTIAANNVAEACHFLTGGDAEVRVWERLWDRFKDKPEALEYDVLQAPHHCSWHTLSHDSWSKDGDSAAASDEARSALAQCKPGAFIISSSNPISDDDTDPPCVRAKQEYEQVLSSVEGSFTCVCEYTEENNADVLRLAIDADGPSFSDPSGGARKAISSPAIPKTEKSGSNRYAYFYN